MDRLDWPVSVIFLGQVRLTSVPNFFRNWKTYEELVSHKDLQGELLQLEIPEVIRGKEMKFLDVVLESNLFKTTEVNPGQQNCTRLCGVSLTGK